MIREGFRQRVHKMQSGATSFGRSKSVPSNYKKIYWLNPRMLPPAISSHISKTLVRTLIFSYLFSYSNIIFSLFHRLIKDRKQIYHFKFVYNFFFIIIKASSN